jgi:hypothetical protein
VSTDDAAAVLAAEDRRYRAMIETDLATLDRLLDDRVSYAHSSGVRDTKDAYLEKVRSGYYDYLRIDHPVERVEVVGDTAVVGGGGGGGPARARHPEDDRQPRAGGVDEGRRRLAAARLRADAAARLTQRLR